MKHVIREFCSRWLQAIALGLVLLGHVQGAEIQPMLGQMQIDDGPLQEVQLPWQWDTQSGDARQLQIWAQFDWPASNLGEQPGVYVAFLFDGGQLFLNDILVIDAPRSDADNIVRWRRPFVVALQPALLRPSGNVVRMVLPAHQNLPTVYVPRPVFGPLHPLVERAELRKFWIHGVQWITLGASIVISLGMLLIWWRNQNDHLYAWLALASILWGLRAGVLLVENVPAAWWVLWRSFWHALSMASTAVLAILSLRLANLRWPRTERLMGVYSALVGLAVALGGPSANRWAGSWGNLIALAWMGGLALGATWLAAHRQRYRPAWVLMGAYALIALAAVHDHLMFWHAAWIYPYFPGWVDQAVLLLRYVAGVLMLAFVMLLVMRYSDALHQLRGWNDLLKERVAERERALAQEFTRITQLEKQKSALQERQRITQDLHDGLGSQLFTTLTQLRTGSITTDQVTEALQACVDELRLALETLRGDACELVDVLADFRYRWSRKAAGMGPQLHWNLDGVQAPFPLAPEIALHALRILQEALTNAFKHANAQSIAVQLSTTGEGFLRLCVEDDGDGGIQLPSELQVGAGYGLPGMQQRAHQIGAQLEVRSSAQGSRVCLTLPVKQDAAASGNGLHPPGDSA